MTSLAKFCVGNFRTIWPSKNLEKNYPDEFRVEIKGSNDIDFNDDNYLKQFQIIHYHRTMCNYEQMEPLMKKLRSFGIKLVMDLDDAWKIGPDHPSYHMVMKDKLHEKILGNIKTADWITTTTSVFADIIKKHNKNVFVLPNTIDPSIPQFQYNNEIKREKVAVGYLGGSSHLADLELLKGMFQRLRVDPIIKKTQIVLCGFDIRGSHTDIDQKTGEIRTRPILPKETSWYQYEKLFTDDYRMIEDKKYFDFLMKFKREDYPNEENMTYRRVWTKLLKKYSTNYDLFDISLAPLKISSEIFNLVKSPLKLAECTFKKKPVICTSFYPKIGPYDEFGRHEKNCILIPERKNHKDWFKYVKKLINSPAMREDLGNQLYEDCKDVFHIDSDSRNRRSFYLSILK